MRPGRTSATIETINLADLRKEGQHCLMTAMKAAPMGFAYGTLAGTLWIGYWTFSWNPDSILPYAMGGFTAAALVYIISMMWNLFHAWLIQRKIDHLERA